MTAPRGMLSSQIATWTPMAIHRMIICINYATSSAHKGTGILCGARVVAPHPALSKRLADTQDLPKLTEVALRIPGSTSTSQALPPTMSQIRQIHHYNVIDNGVCGPVAGPGPLSEQGSVCAVGGLARRRGPCVWPSALVICLVWGHYIGV